MIGIVHGSRLNFRSAVVKTFYTLFLSILTVVAADVNAAPIHDAIKAGEEAKLVEILKATPDQANLMADGKTPLALAVEAKNFTFVRHLIAAGAQDTRADLEAALALGISEVRKDPTSEAANFYTGYIAYLLGEYGQAVMAYNRALYRNPGNTRVRAELARAYYAEGNLEMARLELQDALKQQNIDPALQTRINGFLTDIDNATQKWRWSGHAGFSVFYDDNVNAGPEDSIISIAPVVFFGSITIDELLLDPEALSQESMGASLRADLSVSRDIGAPQGWDFASTLFVQQDFLESDYDDLAIGFAYVDAGFRHFGQRSLFTLPLKADHTTQGNDDLTSRFGINPNYLRAYGERNEYRLRSSFNYELREWDGLRAARDADYFEWGEMFQRLFGGGKNVLDVGARLFYEDAETGIFSRQGYILSAGISVESLWQLQVYANYNFTNSDYDDPSDLEITAREDDRHEFLAGVRKRFGQSWSADLKHRFVDNQSTFEIYDYNRNVTSLSASYEF